MPGCGAPGETPGVGVRSGRPRAVRQLVLAEGAAVITIGIIIVAVYLAFHLGHGHANWRHARAHGLRPNFYWSSVRGPYASVRLPGGFRVGHKL
jgi:hypothetical protein